MKLPALDWELISWPSRRTVVLVAAVVVGLVLVLGGGWFGYSAWLQRGSAVWADALTKVQASLSAQATPEVRETAARQLEGALQQYPSSPMAAQGAYELGNLRYASRQYPQARAAYEIAAAKAGRGTIGTLARAGIGYTWEAERNFAKAAETYRAAVDGLKLQDFFYEELLFDLARVQEQAGQKNEAIETYRRLVKELPRTARAEEARARLASLGVAS